MVLFRRKLITISWSISDNLDNHYPVNLNNLNNGFTFILSWLWSNPKPFTESAVVSIHLNSLFFESISKTHKKDFWRKISIIGRDALYPAPSDQIRRPDPARWFWHGFRVSLLSNRISPTQNGLLWGGRQFNVDRTLLCWTAHTGQMRNRYFIETPTKRQK